jgi:hypothetical protein
LSRLDRFVLMESRMIAQRDLLVLAGLPDYFPLIGDYLRGATIEVQFDTDRGGQYQTHIIVQSGDFPIVSIAAEGSDIRPVTRQFFALPKIYQPGHWDLVDSTDEQALRGLIDHRQTDTEAAKQAARAELIWRIRLRREQEREAKLVATAAARHEARMRLLTAGRLPFRDPRWRLILQDLNIVVEDITREGDRRFIADVTRYGLFTERQFAWVIDIFDRTVRSIRKNRTR